ncbi:unnamed protein product, partial [Linum tenue]
LLSPIISLLIGNRFSVESRTLRVLRRQTALSQAMAGGGFVSSSAGGTEFEAKITPIVIMSCIMAATGGLMFGYDVGVSGGVTSMPAFLEKFFPVVARKTQDPTLNNSNYCKYDNQGLQLFTSSLYLAGLTATFFASYTTRTLGRRPTMLIAGLFFIAGVVLNAAAQDLAMLIVGRILLGCGVGFANQAVPLFLSEIAPTRIRGALNILFQLNVTIGILFANLINYGTAKIKGGWGWRLSLGLAGVPAVLLTQCTGINAIMFYAPVLFNTVGFGSDASLYSAVITGAVNVLSTVVSIYSVDRLGRRKLLLEAGVQMLLSQVVIAVVLGIKVTDHSDDLGKGFAVLVVIMVCTFVSAFAWSWGPLGWLIPSETFPLETRSAGQSVTVCVNLLFTFVIAQAFLSMLCHFKFGIFLFFSGWVAVMSVFVFFLVPETKNVPIEEMTDKVWAQHWLWKRFVEEDGDVEMEGRVGVNGKGNGSNGVDYSS